MQLCSDCKKSILEEFMKNAQQAHKKGEFVPIAIPVIANEDHDWELEDPMPIIFNTEDQNDRISTLLDIGAYCWTQDACDVVIVLDACGRKVDNYEELIKNYDTERPTLYPKSMREDMLIVCHIDLIDEEFTVLTSIYTGEGKDEFFQESVYLESEGVLSGIVEFIIHGFNLMYRFLNNGEENENEIEENSKED
jgi:hypothetical protein